VNIISFKHFVSVNSMLLTYTI